MTNTPTQDELKERFPGQVVTSFETRGLRGIVDPAQDGLLGDGKLLFGFRIFRDEPLHVAVHHRIEQVMSVHIAVDHRPRGEFDSYDKTTRHCQRITVEFQSGTGPLFIPAYEVVSGQPEGVTIERHAWYDKHPVSAQRYLQREVFAITGPAIAIHADKLAALTQPVAA